MDSTSADFRLAQSFCLDTTRGRIAGLRWPGDDGIRVLCVHGWLDNAASFVPMAQHLERLDLVAIDLPGHGQSGHHVAGSHYHLTDYLADIDAAMDALGWDSCHLLGHSLGAALCSLYCVAAPERVLSMSCLDALGPMSAPADTSADRLKRSLDSLRGGPRRRKAYRSPEDMIAARLARSDLSDESARLICERSIQQFDKHFEWTNDPALYWVSPLIMTEEQVHNCMLAIKAPVLSLTAIPYAPFVNEEKVKARGQLIEHGQHELVEGTHHFHMDHPQRTAARVMDFIQQQEKT